MKFVRLSQAALPLAFLAAVGLTAQARAANAATQDTTVTDTTVETSDAPIGTPVKAMPKMKSGIKYISGGIGVDESKAIKADAGKYNLHMALSQGPRNAWVSGANVDIRSTAGKTVLTVPKAGPLLYAKVPPGTYQVVASVDGRAEKRTVTVGARAGKELNLHWDGNTDHVPSVAPSAKNDVPLAPNMKEDVTATGTSVASPLQNDMGPGTLPQSPDMQPVAPTMAPNTPYHQDSDITPGMR